MTLQELITSARGALGGFDRLRGVRSYHSVARRVTATGRASTVAVWRAAGGRIRVEEQSSGGRTVRIANGSNSSPDIETLVRSARIAPRNLLAHADEYTLTLRDHPAADGSRIVSFPAEFILYCFHPETFLCTRHIDLTRDCRTAYSDYRVVDGIATPFLERHSLAEPREGFEDIYQHVGYNLNLPDDLFS